MTSPPISWDRLRPPATLHHICLYLNVVNYIIIDVRTQVFQVFEYGCLQSCVMNQEESVSFLFICC